MQKEYPYTTDLRLTHSKDDADGNMLFGVANSKEMHAYMDTILASGQLVIDPEVRWQIEDAALFYQRVMQYRMFRKASRRCLSQRRFRQAQFPTCKIEYKKKQSTSAAGKRQWQRCFFVPLRG